MNNLEELLTLEKLLEKFKFPVSPILQYAIQEKKEELSGKDESANIVRETSNEIYISKKNESNHRTRAKKRTCLRVYRADGSYIQEKRDANTFAQAIKEIGVLRVRDLNICRDSMNIITKGGNPQYQQSQYHICDNWYVNTHSNSLTKKRQLETTFRGLGLNWRVEMIEIDNLSNSEQDLEIKPIKPDYDLVYDFVDEPIKERFKKYLNDKLSPSTARNYIGILNKPIRSYINKLIAPEVDSVYSFTTEVV